jgi:hypothetical protein
VYGFFKEEPHITKPFYVKSFNDKAFSISLDGENEYVLPEKWLTVLKAHNPAN